MKELNTLTPKKQMNKPARSINLYISDSTQELVNLVTEAANLVKNKGEAAFSDFRVQDSKWRKGETYIFVLDEKGNMIVHADRGLEGKNQVDLKDINGKPIVQGLITAATSSPAKPNGWYHYQWFVAGEVLPRWKSSYVSLVKAPSGKTYIVGSGMYNDMMERGFVKDIVDNAVGTLEKNGRKAFEQFKDPKGPFIAKDAYLFIYDKNGINLLHPIMPNLEGMNLIDIKDANGKKYIKEMLDTAMLQGEGWVDYLWPKPGESVATLKSSYVRKAKLGNEWVMIGCGVYLADAPTQALNKHNISATALMDLVRKGASLLEQQGDQAFNEFRKKGSEWYGDDTYLFVFSLDGKRVFHAADPESEGESDLHLKDILGRRFIEMFLQTIATEKGEGWVHYMWPEPGNIFPTWKSSFVKRVTFPSGKIYLVGSGIYNMQMEKPFVEDVVNRAGDLIEEKGKEAFPLLRDKTGPFVFMDTYVFVMTPDGTELVNVAEPSLEGKNLIELKDVLGTKMVKEEANVLAVKDTAWITGYWFKPGTTKQAIKSSFIKRVQHDGELYFIGCGYFPEPGEAMER
jgi:signal transduction histidine kinase